MSGKRHSGEVEASDNDMKRTPVGQVRAEWCLKMLLRCTSGKPDYSKFMRVIAAW